LFRLVLGGTLGGGYGTAGVSDAGRAGRHPAAGAVIKSLAPGLLARVAVGLLIGGVGFLTIADAGWAHAIGVICLLGFVVTGFAAVGPGELAEQGDGG
jgi:cytochrome d ubiquinol oxidase subunit II